MMKKRELLNFRCGNKGFIFSLDIFLALVIVLLFIFASMFFGLNQNDDNFAIIQQTKIADDAVSVMDYNKRFDSLDKNIIISNIDRVLPDNYNMSFRIECKNKIIEHVNNKSNEFIVSGERVIVTSKMDYCKMRYWL